MTTSTTKNVWTVFALEDGALVPTLTLKRASVSTTARITRCVDTIPSRAYLLLSTFDLKKSRFSLCLSFTGVG
jgi:hypothetical protein